jgi:protein involved in polysaccharide export with SLBB domain
MKRQLRFLFAFLLAAPIALYSQGDPQTPTTSDPTIPQDSQTSRCPDGTYPTSTANGAPSCASGDTGDIQSGQMTTPRRSSLTAGQSENADLTSQSKSKIRQENLILPPEQLSEFQKFVANTTGKLLPIYGANLFRDVPSTFAPNDLAPANSDYVIGPDDELRVRIWGQINYSGNLRVDRSGNVYLPQVGEVHVAGIQFSSLDQHLWAAVSRDFRNFDLSVDLGRIRSIQVYVTGQARRPGAYTISSLSTLVNALFASGGPSAQGSLRHIEVRRNGQTVTDFDLYGLLIHGDKSKDIRLLAEDVLYIAPSGPQVAVMGSVRTPGIYELRGPETIGDMIDAAGKTSTIASSSKISLERVGEHQVRQAMEFAFDPTGLGAPMMDGDILRVLSIVPAYQKTVVLRGDVANQGRFSWKPGMHLSDLIPDRDSLLSPDYWWKRTHLGFSAPEFEPLISNFDANQRRIARNDPFNNRTTYSNELDGYRHDPASPLAQDALNAEFAAQDRRDETTSGNEDPGAMQAQQSNSSNQGGSPNGAPNDDRQGAYPNNQRESSGGGGSVGSQLRQQPGPEGLFQTRRIDVRISASEIDWNYAVIERVDAQTLKTSLIPFDLGKLVLNHDANQNLELQPGDTITVFSQADIKVPLADQTKYVRLEGEFVHAGIYSVQPGETLRDLVRRAGGISPKAYLYGSEFDRESTRILQQQRIDEYIRRVDLDSNRGTLALTASSTGDVANATAAAAAEQGLITRLRQLRATGRIVLHFRSDSSDLDEIPDVALENGDRFSVPPVPATINVVGAVYNQNSFLFETHASAGRYLLMAGGPDRDADWRLSFVIRADGSVISRESVKGLWGNEFKDLRLNPGDTMVVPEKTLRPTALRGFLDWSQIFSQLAFGAAAINVLR